MGKVKLIKGRKLPKGERRDGWESFGASEKSGKHSQKARELGGRRRNRKENSKRISGNLKV